VNLNEITSVVCAGNTTMMQPALRVDPTISGGAVCPTLILCRAAASSQLLIIPVGFYIVIPGVKYVGGM